LWPFSLSQVSEARDGQPNVSPTSADFLGEAAYREEHLDQILGLILLMVRNAMAPEVLDRGGVLATELALLTQRTQRANDQLVLGEVTAARVGRRRGAMRRQAQGLACPGEIVPVEPLSADDLAQPGLA
jgi:hypothetical protein